MRLVPRMRGKKRWPEIIKWFAKLESPKEGGCVDTESELKTGDWEQGEACWRRWQLSWVEKGEFARQSGQGCFGCKHTGMQKPGGLK